MRDVLSVAEGVGVEVVDDVRPAVTLWSGAQAFRTRWRYDRASLEWSVPGLIGTGDDDTTGDALRFDATTRVLREAVLARPTKVLFDDRVWNAALDVPVREGALHLVEPAVLTLPSMDVAMFDLDLAGFVALREGAATADLAGWCAVRAAQEVARLFDAAGRWAGWRVEDPVRRARPMGWPDVREEPVAEGPDRQSLAALLYDWMCIDASPRVRPDEASDPDDVAHLVALRTRARALAAYAADPVVAGVATDVAAHVHWSWGFFRVGE